MAYVGNQPYQVAFVTDTFSGNGSTTAFTMSVAPANTSSVLVAITGVLQDPSTYGVTGNTINFSTAPPSGTSNISCRYLGIPASGVTTTAYRTVTEFTATAGQTTFTPPSYTVGFINVYRNGALLGSADYTATNGTTVVLASAATSGDLVTVESFLVSSVLNAIPATAGSVGSTYIASGAVGSSQLASGAALANIGAGGITQSYFGTNVAGNGPAFSAYLSGGNQTISDNTLTKVTFNAEDFDTANCFDSTTNYRFTPNVAGYYQVGCYVVYRQSPIIDSYVVLRKNGSTVKTGTSITISSGSNLTNLNFGLNALIYMNGTTDYLEIYALSDGTGNLTVIDTSASTYFHGFLARSA